MDTSLHNVTGTTPSHSDDGTSFFSPAQHELQSFMNFWSSPLLIHFLFSEPSNLFLSDFPPHTPAGSIMLQSKFSRSTTYNYNLPNILTSSSPTHHTPDSLVNMLYAPAASVNNVLLGYTMGEGLVNDSMSPYSAFTKTGHCVRGRFLFDGNNLIIVLHAFSPGCIGILTCTWSNDGFRKRVFFTIPSHQYSFLQLPQRVYSSLTINEHLQSTSTDSNRSVASLNPPPTVNIQTLFRKLQGCFIDPSATRDVLNIHSEELALRISGHMYSEMVLGNASSARSLKYEFFSLYSKQRRVERVIARSCSSNLRRAQLCSCSLCDSERTALITFGGRAQSDAQFFRNSPSGIELHSEVDRILDEMLSSPCAVEGQEAVKQAKQVTQVRQPSIRYQHNNSQSNTPPPPSILERLCERSARMSQQLREQKLEEKRRRNRVSAAKSNLKKKLQVEKQERELELLKKRKIELLAVREQLQLENESLKKQAASRVC